MRNLAITLLGIALASCSTAYQEAGSDGGLDHYWAQPDILVVEARGNGYTSTKRIKEMSELWAAEAGLASGYSYMTISNKKDVSSTSYVSSDELGLVSVTEPGSDVAYKMWKVAPTGGGGEIAQSARRGRECSSLF